METVRVARQAMATRFEIVLHGENPVSLRAAGEEALEEIERIEARLSLYRSTSEISHVNARAAREPVRVSPATFRLIEQAARLSAETGGAFDVTIGPLMRCWGFMGGSGQLPSPDAIAEARARVGMHLLELDSKEFTIRFAREGVMIDLGAIGKGYAVGMAGDILREAGVTSALVHGGTSSIYALGHPPDAAEWKVAIDRPWDSHEDPSLPRTARISSPHPSPPLRVEERVPEGRERRRMNPTSFPPLDRSAEHGPAVVHSAQPVPSDARRSDRAALAQPPDEVLAVVPLCDEALSVSAVWGKSFQTGNETFGHVIDPRTGQPTGHAMLAAVALPSTTETDALSTALLTLGSPGLDLLAGLRPHARLLVAGMRGDEFVAEGRGIVVAGQSS